MEGLTELLPGHGKSPYARRLVVAAAAGSEFIVQITGSTPMVILNDAVRDSCDIKYSPVMPAFLFPGEGPPEIPQHVDSIAFFFANAPYRALGLLKPHLKSTEASQVYFTEGLASLLLLNCTHERGSELRAIIGDCPFEYWPLQANKLNVSNIIVSIPSSDSEEEPSMVLPSSDDPELKVYVEQISASLVALWAAYRLYFPEERDSLRQLAVTATALVHQHGENSARDKRSLAGQKNANAIVAALVELSAALSYAVAQGTSGCLPVLSNRSPFPHHSLLGVGGAIRALTKYTRYLESAFMVRSADKVICDQYSLVTYDIPSSIAQYKSGTQFKFDHSHEKVNERFDDGGEFRHNDHVPLITHFSLRHGFMESKFSVTAASESLTAETLPQWTLMTLSHELMHSQVRTIFEALFGYTADQTKETMICRQQFEDFSAWISSRDGRQQTNISNGLRNAILNFCYAIEKWENPIAEAQAWPGYHLPMERLSECYARHKQLAMEIVVHFHDYYFVYACQPKMYIMSLWASWIKVAAPYARPLEYLIRSLATVACGTGLEPRAAFDSAKEILSDGLDALEARGLRSPLFDELRRLTSIEQADNSRALFYPCYYLMDIVRLFFASRTIASKIDRIESDPFAEGSTAADNYCANIYVFGEGESVSPIRYCLWALFKTFTGKLPVDDPQWLTAWNYMVIGS